MKVLIAGANSYIGTRLIPVLLQKGYEVVCLVRDKAHFDKNNDYAADVTVIKGDLLRRQSIDQLPTDIAAAYYLVNSYNQTSEFAALGALSAQNFMEILEPVDCQQIITLGDIDYQITKDTIARQLLEDILYSGKPALTVLNAGMIIGEGSMAVEMFNALTTKSPILITQNWVKTRIQPIAIDDVLYYLSACLLNEKTYNENFDIGGPEVLQFKHMLLTYIAMFMEFKPSIVTIPFLTDKLSDHILNILNPVSFPGAQRMIESLKSDTVARDDNAIQQVVPHQCISFKKALKPANVIAERVH